MEWSGAWSVRAAAAVAGEKTLTRGMARASGRTSVCLSVRSRRVSIDCVRVKRALGGAETDETRR